MKHLLHKWTLLILALLVAILQSSNSTRERLEHTGVLRPEKASMLGIVGVAGRMLVVDREAVAAAADAAGVFVVGVADEGA